MFRSIRFKYVLDLLVVSLVPMAIALFLASHRSRDELTHASAENLKLLATMTAAQLDQLLRDGGNIVKVVAQDDHVRDFAADPSKREALKEIVHRQLKVVPETNPDYDSCFLIGMDGIGLASSAERNVGQDLSFRDYFTAGRNGYHFVSDFTIGKKSGEPGVYFSSPVVVGDRVSGERVVGVVATKLKGERIWDLIADSKAGEGGYAMLVDQFGVVIAHPDESRLYHAVAPLDPSTLKDFDPSVRYSRDQLGSLNVPELLAIIRGKGRGNMQAFEQNGEQWVAGVAPMAAKPWIAVVVKPAHQFSAAVLGLAKQQGRIAAIVALAAGLYAVWRARNMVRPLIAMNDAAKKLASGDFSARADVRRTDEIGQLAGTFNEMVPQLEQSVELQRSVELAQRIQQSLLPQHPPKIEGLDLFGRSRYCDATGGDYFDFADAVHDPHGRLVVAIGDVTGHGLGAALLMCTARAALRASAQTSASLGQNLTHVNTVLTEDAVEDLFMTMTLMTIDPATRTIRYGCAAHDPIMIFHPETGEMTELSDGSIPLGAMPGMDYEEYRYDDAPPGAIVFIGTDGIWEARNPSDEMFGKDRMVEAIKSAISKPAGEIGAAVEASLEAFLEGRKIQDDVTYVVMKLV